MSEVGCGLEMPAPAALDQFDPAPLVMRCQLAQRDLDTPLADMLGDLLDAQRFGRGEQGRFDGPRQLVHHAAFLSLIGENGSSWAISSRPSRASSSAARKLDAKADRRSCKSSVS